MGKELNPLEHEWELIRERELKNTADIHSLLQRVIDNHKQDGTYSEEDVKLAKDKLRKEYESERVGILAYHAPPSHITWTCGTPGSNKTINTISKARTNDDFRFLSTNTGSLLPSMIESTPIKAAQLPDLTITLLTTVFNLITGFVFAVHAIFMQWTILYLVGQMVMIEFNDLLREDIEKLLEGEMPDLSSPGIIAIILWALETLVALALTLVVQEEESDKSWIDWAWKVGRWAVAPFFIIDGIAVVAVIMFFTGNMDIQNVWLVRLFYSLTSITGYIGGKKAVSTVSTNMPAIKSYGNGIKAKLAFMCARVTTTIGGPWRDTVSAPATSAPATSSLEVVQPTSSDRATYEIDEEDLDDQE